jgi:hypothetical protein
MWYLVSPLKVERSYFSSYYSTKNPTLLEGQKFIMVFPKKGSCYSAYIFTCSAYSKYISVWLVCKETYAILLSDHVQCTFHCVSNLQNINLCVSNEWPYSRMKNSNNNESTDQAVSRNPIIAEARFLSQSSRRGTSNGQSGTGVCFSPITVDCACQRHSGKAPYTYLIYLASTVYDLNKCQRHYVKNFFSFRRHSYLIGGILATLS